jgi:anti-repressor protein
MEKPIRLSKKGHAITDTYNVAKAFGKRNSNLMRSVRLIMESAFGEVPFALSKKEVNGKIIDVYVMTKAGFMVLCRKFRDVNPDDVKRFIDMFGEYEQNAQKVVESIGDKKFISVAPETTPKEFPLLNMEEAKKRVMDALQDDLITIIDAVTELACNIVRNILATSQEQATPQEQKAVEPTGDNVSVNELAKMICSYGYDIGEIRLYEWLINNGYLCSVGGDYNLPTQQAIQQGLFVVRAGQYKKPTGQMVQTRTTRVTQKGQVYFVNKFIFEKQGKQ